MKASVRTDEMHAAPPSFQRHLQQNGKEWLILMMHYFAWQASKHPRLGFVAAVLPVLTPPPRRFQALQQSTY